MFQAIREKATGRLTEWREIDPDPELGYAPVMTPTDPANYELKNYDFDPLAAAKVYLNGGNPGVIYVDAAGKTTALPPGPDSLNTVKALLALLEYAKSQGKSPTDPITYGDLIAVGKLIHTRQINLDDDGSNL